MAMLAMLGMLGAAGGAAGASCFCSSAFLGRAIAVVQVVWVLCLFFCCCRGWLSAVDTWVHCLSVLFCVVLVVVVVVVASGGALSDALVMIVMIALVWCWGERAWEGVLEVGRFRG